MPENDLYVLARELSKQFTKSKYKSFLIINNFVKSDALDEFDASISGFVPKEDFIRETFSLIEDWERFVEWFSEQDEFPSEPSVSTKPTENAALSERMKTISQKGRIFISYRRVDSEGYAGRIYDHLAPHFGDDAIFMDVDDIPAGVDFVKFLENEVQSCDVFIALIGRQWLNLKGKHGKRRLDNPNDFVRIEIATALRRDIRVIPVLLGGTQMPQVADLPENLQSLTRRNGLPVYHHSFHTDTNRLIEHLEDALNAAEKARKGQEEKARKEKEAADKAAKEKAEREAAEKAEQERRERERLERDEKARKEKETAEKAAREKAKREAEERVKKEKEKREGKEREEKTHRPSKLTIGDMEFLRIPKGKFTMGDKKEEHEVDIPYDYFLARFPVTNQLFKRFVDATNFSKSWGVKNWNEKLDHPVVGVLWHTAQAYCKWLNQEYGSELPVSLVFRLPTEAEWEKAARGTDRRQYPWGNEFDKNKCNSKETYFNSKTTSVGNYSPRGDSPYGISDMAGNVWEWMHSLYQEYPYRADDGRESEEAQGSRVLRGGSFSDLAPSVRAVGRVRLLPVYLFVVHHGFRVALATPLPK